MYASIRRYFNRQLCRIQLRVLTRSTPSVRNDIRILVARFKLLLS